jgi:hypothetical protein
MSLDPTKNPERDGDKHLSTLSVEGVEPSASGRNKSSEDDASEQQRGRHLTVPVAQPSYRSASPDAVSIISAEEAALYFEERSTTQPLLTGESSPLPTTWKGKIAAYWKRSWGRNKGVFLVLLAQVFGTIMTMTAQILEIEGNDGKGMNPFQVGILLSYHVRINADLD